MDTISVAGQQIPHWRWVLLLLRCLAGSAVLFACSVAMTFAGLVSSWAFVAVGAGTVAAAIWSLYWLRRLINARLAELTEHP